MQNVDYSSMIKQMVSVPDAAQMYIDKPIRHNRIPCPFHGGTEYNLGLKPKWFHCFVCGAGGDVIDFTRKLHGLSWYEAVEKLNDDFCLNLPMQNGSVLTEDQKKRIAESKEKLTKSLLEELEQHELALQYDTMCDLLGIVERICQQDAPAPWDDEWDPVWCQAMRMRTELKEHIEQLDLERLRKEEVQNGKRR